MLVLLDWLIEPVAVKYDFWQWTNTVVPMQNYIAWFIISALLLFIFNKFEFQKNNKLAQALYIIQLVFFASLAVL